MAHKLFVYGTLKKGHRLNFLLQKGMFMGKYETVDSDFRMENYFDAFPVVYRDPEGKKIKGRYKCKTCTRPHIGFGRIVPPQYYNETSRKQPNQ